MKWNQLVEEDRISRPEVLSLHSRGIKKAKGLRRMQYDLNL